MAESITESICKILGVDKKEVIVVFQEAPNGNWYAEGKCLYYCHDSNVLLIARG